MHTEKSPAGLHLKLIKIKNERKSVTGFQTHVASSNTHLGAFGACFSQRAVWTLRSLQDTDREKHL